MLDIYDNSLASSFYNSTVWEREIDKKRELTLFSAEYFSSLISNTARAAGLGYSDHGLSSFSSN